MASLPILLGLSPLGGGDLHFESRDLIQRLQGRGAYSTDPDSNRAREVLAWAEMHALARQRLDALGDNLLPDKAQELLEAWEAYLRVTNNAPRNEDERQVRAFRFYNLIVAADRTTLDAFVDALVTGATLHTPTQATVSTHQCSPETVFHFTVLMSDAQYDDPATRKVFDILVRILPMRSLGQMSRPNAPNEQVVTVIDGKFGGAQVLGRTALMNDTSKTQAQLRPVSRYRDYGPLSRLTADDLNQLQEAFVCEGVAGVNTLASAEDGLYRFFAASLAATAATEIDLAEWRDRVGTLFCRYGTTDIRPGEAAQFDMNDVGNDTIVPFYTGTGETGVATGVSRYEAELDSSGIFIRASSTNGRLEIYNTTGTVNYIVGCVWASGDTGER